MAIAEIINFNNNVGSGIRLGPADHWDGYSENIAGNIFGGIFQGLNLNWGGFGQSATLLPFDNQPYVGYNTNWGSFITGGVTDAFVAQPYVGYNTNWGSVKEIDNKSLNDTDINATIDHPKNQKIYYKLRGFNSLTNDYEVWVISQNITGRPALDGGLFDPTPGREPPNYERDVFKTPPSGNSLIDIMIIARWIQ